MSAPIGNCRGNRPKFFVSQATYTATCDGHSVSVTKEGRSPMSVEHAHQRALSLARCEAERLARQLCCTNGTPPAFASCLPDQTDHAGDVLYTDGDQTYWDDPPEGGEGGSGTLLYAKQLRVDKSNDGGGSMTGTREDFSLPYPTIALALTAALAGDTLRIGVGDWNEHLLLKVGVKLQFDLGGDVIYTGAVDGGIFDDTVGTGTGAAVVTAIRGGIFANNGTATGVGNVLFIENPASIVDLDADELTASSVATSTSVVDHIDGRVTVNAKRLKRLGAGQALFWSNGEGQYNLTELSAVQWPVWTEVENGATVTGELTIRATTFKCTGGQYPAFTLNDDNPDARCWFYHTDIIGGTNAAVCGKANVVNGAKYYFIGHKATFTPIIQGSDSIFQIQSGITYLFLQKWEMPDSTNGVCLRTVGTGTALAHGIIQEVLFKGACLNIMLINDANKTIKLALPDCIGNSTTGGIKITAGKLRLRDSNVSVAAKAGESPLIVSGTADVILTNVTLISDGTAKCIKNFDGNPHTVICYGCRANVTFDSNITVVGDLLIDPAFV